MLGDHDKHVEAGREIDDPTSVLRALDELPPGWAIDVDPVVVS